MNRNPLKHFMKTGNTAPPLRRAFVEADTGFPLDLTGATAELIMLEPDLSTAKINRATGIEDPPTSGIILENWQTGDFGSGDEDKSFPTEIKITLASGKIMSFPPNREEPGKKYIFVITGKSLG